MVEYLEDAADMIAQDRGRSFGDPNPDTEIYDNAPRGIVNISYRLAANMVIRQKIRQHASTVQRNDYDSQMVSSEVFTSDIARDLLMYPANYTKRVSFMRVRNLREIEDSLDDSLVRKAGR